MNLVKAIGTIGGLTMVSRVLGFARDMIGSRVLGASHANDAFNLAFLLPNIFRRLFAEGAFSVGLRAVVQPPPAVGRASRTREAILERDPGGVHADAAAGHDRLRDRRCRAFLLVVAGDYQRGPGQVRAGGRADPLDLPLSVFISLVALLSGVLNSLTRFAVAAFAPALLNVALIVALAGRAAGQDRDRPLHGDRGAARRRRPVRACAGSRCAAPGVQLRFGRPRMTPAVRELVVLILPATVARRRLPDQPALLRLLLVPARRRRADQSELCRPAQPAAAVDHRHRARRRDPARDQPGDRARRRGRGRRRPGPRLRPVDAADPARDARAGGRRRADHRRALPGRRI